MITTLLAFSLLATPQTPTEGFFQDVPITVTGLALKTIDHKELWVTNDGAAPVEPLMNYDSRFSRAAMLGTSTAASNIRFGSFSRGRAYITAQKKSGKVVAELGANRWCFQLYTVSMQTVGATNSIYQQQNAYVGGTLFSYILKGSDPTVIPPEFVDKIQVARKATEMKVLDMHGIDSYVHSHLLGGDANDPTAPVEFYFTINRATIDDIPDGWNIAAADKHPATIFCIQHTNGVWTKPTVFLTHSQLNLPKFQPGTNPQLLTEIDALTVDKHKAGDVKVLVSTTDKDLSKQLWIYWQNEFYAGPYYNENAMDLYVTKNLGLVKADKDNITGICADDPEIIENLPTDDRHEWRNRLTAFPEPTPGANLNLVWSGHRERGDEDSTGDRYRITLTRHADNTNPQDTAAILYIMNPDGTFTTALYGRDNNDPIDRITHIMDVPNVTETQGFKIRMAWAVLHVGGTAFTHGFHFWR